MISILDSHGELHQLVDEASLMRLVTLHRIGSTVSGSRYTGFWGGHRDIDPNLTKKNCKIQVVSFKQNFTTAVDAITADLAGYGWG